MCCFVLGRACCLALYGMGRPLAFGSGPVRCFVWDVLGLCCRSLCLLRLRGGGFGYRGGALVYGRRHGAGGTVLAVVRFPRGAQGAARHGVCSGLAAALCGGLCGTPVQTVAAGRIRKIRHARLRNAQDSCKKSGKKPKNVLQNKHTILYN